MRSQDLLPERLRDAEAERFGYLLTAPLSHDLAQLDGEVEGVAARRAVVEVALDDDPPFLGELAVEVDVERLERLATLVACHQASTRCAKSATRGHPSLTDQAACPAKLVQPLLERPSSAVQSAHHRTDGDVEDLGDLLVGETLDVGEEHGHAELLGQLLDRLLHLTLRQVVEQLVLGAAPGGRPLEPAEVPVEREGLDVVDVGLFGPQ